MSKEEAQSPQGNKWKHDAKMKTWLISMGYRKPTRKPQGASNKWEHDAEMKAWLASMGYR